jgi:thiol-disulfide isomerase/thioredoxin
MKPRSGLFAAVSCLAVAVLVLSGCSGGSSESHATPADTVIPVAKRVMAGDAHGPLLAGGAFDVKQDLGHITIVNFFASWCGSCQVETPQFDALYRQDKASGVRFVGLDVKDGSQGQSRVWLAMRKISYPVVWDQPGRTEIELGKLSLKGLPGTVVIDAQGRIAAVYPYALQPADLTPAIDTLQKQS